MDELVAAINQLTQTVELWFLLLVLTILAVALGKDMSGKDELRKIREEMKKLTGGKDHGGKRS